MKSTILTLFLLLSGITYSQFAITIDAVVLNGVSNEPVEFANIQFLNKNLGTVSDGNGKFILEFDDNLITDQDLLLITAIGYAPKRMTLEEVDKILEKQNVLFLNPTSETLSKRVNAIRTNTITSAYGDVYGTVVSEAGPIQGAIVKVKDSYKETATNVEGQYRIDASAGDVLQVSHLGMNSQEVLISEIGEVDITLISDGELLDEVYLETTIETAYGEKNIDAVGYAAAQVTSEDIASSYQTLDQILAKLTGVQSAGTTTNRTYYFTRSIGSSVNGNTLPIFVIDNVIYEQAENNQLPPIDVQNIASITALPGVAAGVRYGTLGRSGAIIIKTKVLDVAENGIDIKRNRSALVEGNNYQERVPFYDTEKIVPVFLAQLQNADSFEEAKRIYESQPKKGREIPYYTDVSDYFAKWDTGYAAQVALSIAEMAPTNAKALRTVAFKLEEFGKLEEAKSVYQRIALLRPQESQSYRDLAHVYKETGEITKSFGLYKRILANQSEGINFEGIQGAAENELQHLITRHKSKVDYKDLPNDLLVANYKKDIRVVLEWNDPNAEFEVQFVNPQRKYFLWKHDSFTDKERILKELETGYSMEEFVIDGAEKGSWLINVKYTGEEQADQNPSFLKYTIYKNYGLANETKDVKTVKLYAHTEKVSVDAFVN